MGTVTQHAEPDLCLEVLDLECLGVVIILVSGISADETGVGSTELGLTFCVCEIKLFCVVYEHVLGDV